MSTIESALLGSSRAIARVRQSLIRLSAGNATVLIIGESGSGKELAAREIHARGPRADAPFVVARCSDLSPERLDAILAGERGTLFLDEVAESSPALQARLVRLLEERGADDVRLIAATKRDLKEAVVAARLREDLYYHLHVVPVVIPPLRDRPEDVLPLAEVFLRRAAARNGLAPRPIGERARAALRGHSWPGNVRELANVMEAAALLVVDGEIEPENLPGVPALSTWPSPQRDFASSVEALFDGYRHPGQTDPPPLRQARLLVERAYLSAVLERVGGNVTLAAKVAGRNRTDFYDLLRRHEVDWSDLRRRDD